MSVPLARVPVGIVVERRKARNPWVEFVWRPVAALPGLPEAAPWSVLDGDVAVTRYYAGGAEVELYRSDVPRYAENLASRVPSLWVILRATGGEPPYRLMAVTANPSEGEAFTESGDDLVETVPMPSSTQAALAAFVTEHPMQEAFHKRQQTRADPDALARRDHVGRDRKP